MCTYFRPASLIPLLGWLWILQVGIPGWAPPSTADDATRPNVVIVLADDLGYGDLNLSLPAYVPEFRHPEIQTPNLAKLASQSIVFRHHYAAAPVCSPSRAGLLTGRTPTRCNIGLYISDLRDDGKRFLAGPEITIAELAKQAGYRTAIFGKWHLNGADWEQESNWTGWTGSFPKQQGFDEGWVTKENPHFTRRLQVNTQRHPGDIFTVDGKPRGIIKGYTSDLITDAAIEWMNQRHDTDQPFLLYLPYDAVHIRINSPDRFESMYDTGDPRKDVYYANVSHLDEAIGRLIHAIDDQGLRDDTIILFSSDNGPDVLDKWHGTAFCMGTSYPLAGHKYQLDEGGVRVPGLISWPAKFGFRVSDVPNSTLDWLPTLCDVMGVNLPDDRELDGVSLQSHLLDGGSVRRTQPLYWQFEHPAHFANRGHGYQRRQNGRDKLQGPHASVSIRVDDHVLRGLQTGPYAAPEAFELFNVVTDRETRNNIAGENIELVNRLRDRLLKMHADVARDRQRTLKFIETRGQVWD